MTKETIDVQGCVDCLMFCANGELPPENTEFAVDQIKTKIMIILFQLYPVKYATHHLEAIGSPCI